MHLLLKIAVVKLLGRLTNLDLVLEVFLQRAVVQLWTALNKVSGYVLGSSK